MRKARKLSLWFFGSVALLGGQANAQQKEESTKPVVAMDARKAKSIRAGELITAGAENSILVGRNNTRVELSPRSVAEFDENISFRLLRGSAVVECREECSMRTAGAKVEFVGKTIVSYDHVEKSSSAFVLEGEARMVNPHRTDSSLRLQRYRGATLVVGDVLPQMIRQLDLGAVRSWLKGYSWNASRVDSLLKGMPGESVVAQKEAPKHLEEARIEDYFSSIDTADELHQPDYYEKKFDDPDKVVAEQNSAQGAGKVLSPEEAALISLPKTQIDLGFELGPEFLTDEQKRKELAKVDTAAHRAPASVGMTKEKKVRKKTVAVIAEPSGDPEVNQVLERLRRVRTGNSQASQGFPAPRGPASLPSPVVPDPVYDYSQNF